MKRLFVAIEASDKLKKELLIFSKKHPIAGVRWVAFQNLHITIQFLGWIEEDKISSIKKDIQKITQTTAPFPLKFEKLIFAPPAKKKRMIWATLSGGGQYQKMVKEISFILKKYISENLKEADENILRKNRTPHITLARFKNSTNLEGLNLDNVNIKKEEFWVSEVSLWESSLNHSGAKYKIIEKFKFK